MYKRQGYNKPLSTSYFYHDGSQGPEGWYIEGAISQGTQDDNPVLKAGQGFVIRKQAAPKSSELLSIDLLY